MVTQTYSRDRLIILDGSKTIQQTIQTIAATLGIRSFQSAESPSGDEKRVFILCSNTTAAIQTIKKTREHQFDYIILVDTPPSFREFADLIETEENVFINIDELQNIRIRTLTNILTGKPTVTQSFFSNNKGGFTREGAKMTLSDFFPETLPHFPNPPSWMPSDESPNWEVTAKNLALPTNDWIKIFLGFPETVLKHIHFLLLLGKQPALANSLEKKLKPRSIFYTRTQAAITLINKGGGRKQAKECVVRLLEKANLGTWLNWSDSSEIENLARSNFCGLIQEVELLEDLLERLEPLNKELDLEHNEAIRSSLGNAIASSNLNSISSFALKLNVTSEVDPRSMSLGQLKLTLKNRIRTTGFNTHTKQIAQEIKRRLKPQQNVPLLCRYAANSALLGDLEAATQLLDFVDIESFKTYDKDISTFITSVHNSRSFAKADALYVLYSKREQKTPSLKLRWAMTKICLGETQTATQLLEDELANNGPSDGVVFWLARLKRLSNRPDTARNELERYLPHTNTPIVKFYYLCEIALCHAESGELEPAFNKFKESLATDKSNPLWLGIATFEAAAIKLILEGKKSAQKLVSEWLPIVQAATESPKLNPGLCLARLLGNETSNSLVELANTLEKRWPLPQFPYHKWSQVFLNRIKSNPKTASKKPHHTIDLNRKPTSHESNIIRHYTELQK